MNKVTTINLNGTAYQLEEGGYEQLKKYLAQAKKKLADDPDKDEVLADFERAIAEKCNDKLKHNKNVVTDKEMAEIIEEMGPVEAAEGEKSDEPKEEADQQPKRLYTLRDGAIIGGVANGLAAYFNIDVTIVRLAFVILTFITSGAVILVYLLMMLIVPEARTPEQKAELRGERFTAQDVLSRAKRKYADIGTKEHWQNVAESSQPALSNVGDALEKLFRILCLIITAFLTVILALVTASWISGLWWLAFGHVQLQDQLSTIPLWTVALAATAAYFIVALPLGVLTGLFAKIGSNRPFGKLGLRGLAVAASLWVVSACVMVGVGAVTGGRISDYQSSHAYVHFGQKQLCINANLCNENNGPVFQSKPFEPAELPVPVIPPPPVQPK